MNRHLTSLVLLLVLASGCAMPGKKQPEAGVNVPGKSEAPKQVATEATGDAKSLFLEHYLRQCKQQLTAMGPLPIDSAATPKNPDEVCNCVGDKIWAMQQKQGTPIDPVASQKEMMACMGIDMEEMNRKVAEKRRMAEQMAEQGDTEFIPPETPQQATEETPPDPASEQDFVESAPATPSKPQPKRNLKYDPKTGTWSN